MKKMPRFVLVRNKDELSTNLVLERVPPFFIAYPYSISQYESEKVEEWLSDIANGWRVAVKVEGYSVFLSPYTTLSGDRLPEDKVLPKLREMAEFFLQHGVLDNKHRYRLSKEK